jgi:hypothetical protein
VNPTGEKAVITSPRIADPPHNVIAVTARVRASSCTSSSHLAVPGHITSISALLEPQSAPPIPSTAKLAGARPDKIEGDGLKKLTPHDGDSKCSARRSTAFGSNDVEHGENRERDRGASSRSQVRFNPKGEFCTTATRNGIDNWRLHQEAKFSLAGGAAVVPND